MEKKGGKRFIKRAGMLALALAPMALMFAGDASAETLGGIATDITTNTVSGAIKLITGGAYLGGVALGVKGALQLKNHNEDPRAVPISRPIVTMVVAAALLALPTFLKSGVETTFGSGAQMNSANGSMIQ